MASKSTWRGAPLPPDCTDRKFLLPSFPTRPISETARFHAKYRCVSSWNLEFFFTVTCLKSYRGFSDPGQNLPDKFVTLARLYSRWGDRDYIDFYPSILRNRNYYSVLRHLILPLIAAKRRGGVCRMFDRFAEFRPPSPLIARDYHHILLATRQQN